ncbi:exported hypothetical protein [Frankia sp. Hr75.2]|nr:exported hypothetical protein [Frankia sp. Hr75.2]
MRQFTVVQSIFPSSLPVIVAAAAGDHPRGSAHVDRGERSWTLRSASERGQSPAGGARAGASDLPRHPEIGESLLNFWVKLLQCRAGKCSWSTMSPHGSLT